MGDHQRAIPRPCRGLVFGFFAPRAPSRGSGGIQGPFQQRTWAQRGRRVWGQPGLGDWPRADAPPWGQGAEGLCVWPPPQAPS